MSCALQAVGMETVAVTHRPAGSYNSDGYFTPGVPSTVNVQAHVQPAGSRDLEVVPEALRNRKTIALWTTAQLLTTVDKAQQADLVTYMGDRFEVHQVWDWSVSGGYYKSLAVLVDET